MRNVSEQLSLPVLKQNIKSFLIPPFLTPKQNKRTVVETPPPEFTQASPTSTSVAEAETLYPAKKEYPYSVTDYLALDGKAFGAMRVQYKPQRAKFYVSLSYRSADFELNRRDIKRIAQPFNQRLKIWPVPVANYQALLAVLRRAEKRTKRHLNRGAQNSLQKSTTAPLLDERVESLEAKPLQDWEGRKIAVDFLNKRFGDVQVREVQERIGLEFPYECAGFYKIKENIKQLEGWSYRDKCWRVPFRHVEKVREILDFAVSCQQMEAERLEALTQETKSQLQPKAHSEMRQKSKMGEVQKAVESLKRHVQQKGAYPKTTNRVVGETLLSTMDQKGKGECWVIEADKIWFIRNNGRIQDDWRHNNISVAKGGGAIGLHIPYQQDIVEMLRHADHSTHG